MDHIEAKTAKDAAPENGGSAQPAIATAPGKVRGSVAIRVAVLFAVLCAIKILILVTFGKHLFEIHWRVSTEQMNGWTWAAFYLFALLAGLNLWVFGERCLAGGARAARAANTWVLGVTGLFILLTFHEQKFNYLQPVLNGTLRWADLRWYLYNHFFFAPPFLGAWIAGYALLYFGLARAGRERLMLRITAVCAVAYIVLCLRDLAAHWEGLVAADCLGVATLAGGWRKSRALNPLWLAPFLAGIGLLLVLFRPFDAQLAEHMSREFIILSLGSFAVFSFVTVMAWRQGFFTGWTWLLPFALSAFLLFVNTNYNTAANYYHLLFLGLTFPHYFLGELAIAALVLALAKLYRRWRPAGSLLWLDVLSLGIIAVSLIDLRLSQIMGVRLNWQALSLALGETPRMMWRMSRPYLPKAGAALAAVALIYFVLLRVIRPGGAWNQNSETRKPRWGGALFSLLAVLLLGIAGHSLSDNDKAAGQTVVQLAATSPLWQRTATPVMSRTAFAKAAQSLGMWQSSAPITATPPPPRRDLNVVLIFQESTYDKYLSLFGAKQDTEPLLSKYRDRMEIFTNFYSSFPGSINARFATFTGLYPVRDFNDFTAHHVPVKSIFEILHDHGYATSLFYSSFFDYTDFRDFLRGRELDEMYDADTMPGPRKTKPVSWGLREEETLGAIKGQIKKYAAQRQKFFLTYIPAAPHNPFDGTPARFRKHPPGKMGDFTPLYLNELLYMDWVISSIVDQLKTSGVLDHTLVVITDDHGEMLGANGGPIGHGWKCTPDLTRIPLIIMDPGRPGFRFNDALGSQVDLLPTMLDLLGIRLPADQLYQGVSLYSPAAFQRRTIYLSSFDQYAVISGNSYYVGSRDDTTNAIPIGPFDRFQANFLRNYAIYSRRQSPALAHR